MFRCLKDNDPNSSIVVEDKSNPSQNMSNEYQPNEIFKFSIKSIINII